MVPGEVLVVPCVVLVVPGVVLVAPGELVVAPGCEVVELGLVVCVPIPAEGVTVPVFCAVATPTASASTDDANKIFRIEDAPCSELLRLHATNRAGTRIQASITRLFKWMRPGRG